jgi:hypothetical protein
MKEEGRKAAVNVRDLMEELKGGNLMPLDRL